MLGSLSREIFAIPSIVQRTSIADLLPPHFFLSLFFPNAFHFGRNSTESNISHRNGRTISTFSELIIGSAARVPWGCQSLQIYRDLLVKSTGDVCMKIHVNIQLYTLTICKFPGNQFSTLPPPSFPTPLASSSRAPFIVECVKLLIDDSLRYAAFCWLRSKRFCNIISSRCILCDAPNQTKYVYLIVHLIAFYSTCYLYRIIVNRENLTKIKIVRYFFVMRSLRLFRCFIALLYCLKDFP